MLAFKIPPWPMAALMLLVASCLALTAGSGARAEGPLRQEETFLRIKVDERDVRLEALIVRPENAQGRLPLALVTHGKSASSVRMGELRAVDYAWIARDLARRGWLAAVVIRRGFGQSDGPVATSAACTDVSYVGRLGSDVAELEGALRTLTKREDVDPDRIIAIGESAGGAAVLALAQNKPPGLRGIINIAGGLALEGCEDKTNDAMVRTIIEQQKPGTPPQLWIYAKNDDLFPPALVDRMRGAALDAGDDIRYVELAEIKPTGHLVFGNTQGRFAWLNEMDTSLRAWKLPTWSTARVREYYGKLGIGNRSDTFERYFAAPGERAMALSRSGKRFNYVYAANTLDEAKNRALQTCRTHAKDCVVAFENDQLMLAE